MSVEAAEHTEKCLGRSRNNVVCVPVPGCMVHVNLRRRGPSVMPQVWEVRGIIAVFVYRLRCLAMAV